MRKEIIDKYGIDFQNENNDGIIDKIPGSNLKYVTHLLYDWGPDDIDDPDHGLLTDIDAALADPNSEIQAGSEMVDLLIYQDRVEFEHRSGGTYTMPTSDLREIVMGWRDFLLTPPIDGSKI
ncbi:hypothetical protein [Mucilaginibacter rubeus]|uniref:Uncharacterized protein n=1 Tax=Mucilaginibacter rubeus TaxID=2027860 RepID=A0A5C1HYP4_9SPHI|nr:hypothetical protein [Mucilaginibacter rubeus]QEM10599.1 hypothetical protein DEO27_011400 [Mucilaginibacter rubeus]